MTRDQVLDAIRVEYSIFLAVMEGISDDDIATARVIEEWTIKDLMGHIAMWQQVAVKFVNEYLQDGLPKSLGLKDDAAVNAYNERGWQSRRALPLAHVRAEFDAAFRDLVAAVEKLGDVQLSAPLPAPWEQGTTLERLIAINSYEHDSEHTAQIQKWKGGTK